jgi:hypothetical protein
MKKKFPGIAGCLVILGGVLSGAVGRAAAFAPEDGFGVGVVLGSPTGLSGSLPLGKTNAINAVIGYDLNQDPNLCLQADYLWIAHGIIGAESGKVSLYYGPGAFVTLSGSPSLGLRAVVGADYWFEQAPVQLFLELGPGLTVIPETRPNPGVGLGARYYF